LYTPVNDSEPIKAADQVVRNRGDVVEESSTGTHGGKVLVKDERLSMFSERREK
jgi:hypothetical protein